MKLDWAIHVKEDKPSLPLPVLSLQYFVFLPLKVDSKSADGGNAEERDIHTSKPSQDKHVSLYLDMQHSCSACKLQIRAWQQDDPDEGNKPKHVGVTIKLFCILRVVLLEFLFSPALFLFFMHLGSRWSCPRNPCCASVITAWLWDCVDYMIDWNYTYDWGRLFYSKQLKPPQWEYPACCCPLVFRQRRWCWRERLCSSSVYHRDSMYKCCIITAETTSSLYIVWCHIYLLIRLVKSHCFMS